MLVEIRGVGFKNKGAELMLRAVVEQFAESFRDCGLAAAPAIGPYAQRARLGLYQKVRFDRLGIAGGAIGALIPKRFLRSYGLATEAEIDAVLDASGFAYSDQWGPNASEVMAAYAKRWHGQGKKIILLPQAFGPFQNGRVRNAFLQILDNVDLVFARDKVSFDHIAGLGGRISHVKIVPDITILLKGRTPSYADQTHGKACIIPNYRMIDKTQEGDAGRYVSFLAECGRHLLQRGIDTFILVHELDPPDLELASKVRSEIRQDLQVVQEPDPVFIKGILGSSLLVVGSRFHGLTSALSQGVPCIAAGWSHKYNSLLEDYGCPELSVSLQASKDEIIEKLERLIEARSRTAIVQKLNAANAELSRRVGEMWTEVRSLLGASRPTGVYR
jgi:colanic acid/amylovoran biosynthesis protein